MPAKKPAAVSAQFTFVSESSDYANILGTNRSGSATLPEYGPPVTYKVNPGQASKTYVELTNVANELVRYYADTNGDGRLGTGDTLVYSGAPSGFTFRDLLAASGAQKANTFFAAFEDDPNNPDRDYNDFVTRVDVSGGGVTVRPNAGRGNGAEIGLVNGEFVDLDPGRSSPQNNGGDVFGM